MNFVNPSPPSSASTKRPQQPIIELQDVTIELGGEIILKSINFTVFHGDTIILVGPSGSGKSVLIKTMAGVIKPKSGRVLCEGEDWQDLHSEEKRKLAQHIGVQFQQNALFDSMTAFENVAFPLREHFPEMKEADIAKQVKTCLESVDLWEARDQMPHELSGGMQLRLGVARSIALNPKINFYDDPTAGLDPVNSDKMADLILDLKKKYDSTLIVVTHDMMRAYQMAGRIVLVANQEIIETGSAEQTRHHPDPRVQQFIHGELHGPLIWG